MANEQHRTKEASSSISHAPAPTAVIETNDGFVLLWSIAEAMTWQNGESRDRNWLTLMRAFWKGEFARGGLTLRQRRPNAPGSEMFPGLTREELVSVPLGEDRAARMGLDAAYDELVGWRVEDYRDIREGFRYYFERDPQGTHGLGVGQTEAADWIANAAITRSGRAWLKLCEAVNLLAFGEALGKEALTVVNYPWDRTLVPRLRAAWRQCRQEASTDEKFAAFLALLRDEDGKWREVNELIERYRASHLRDFTGLQPPSAQALAGLLTEYEPASRECSEALDSARSAIRQAMLAGDLKLSGVRLGQLVFEDIDCRLIDGTIDIKDSMNIVQEEPKQQPHRDPKHLRMMWDKVHVERQAFGKWRDRNYRGRGARAACASSSSTRTKRWPKGPVMRAFEARVTSWPAGKPLPNEDEDRDAMREKFPGLSRDDFREIRRAVAAKCGCADWVKRGRKKKRSAAPRRPKSAV